MLNKKFRYILILFLALAVTGLYAVAPALYINEFLASNSATNIDPDFSEFTDWVEIYNAEDYTIDLGGYYLTDNLTTPTEWRIPNGSYVPAGSVIIFWTDDRNVNNHTNFKLSRDGDDIALFNPSGQLVDGISFGEQVPDVSRGRKPDGANTWVYYGEPTPNALNTSVGVQTQQRGPTPIFNLSGGLYQEVQTLELSGSLDSMIIRVTFDGSLPNSISSLYDEPISLWTTTVVRARAFYPDYLPSEATTHTYFIDDTSTLPIFSIAINPEYIWDDEIGIMVNGVGCDDPIRANSCQGWERPAHVEFYEPDGRLGLSLNTGIQVRGSQSCIFPRKQFGLYARDKYGQDELKYRFFDDKYIDSFKRLVLRPGGADGIGNFYRGTMFRDEMITTLVKDRMNIDYSAYRPSIVFLNGEYWGIHNIRERIKQYYLASNYGLDRKQLDILENPNNGGVFQGDDQHYRAMLAFIETNDVSLAENYTYIKTQMDIDEFINYQIVQIYVANAEWGNSNIQCWRPQTEDGRWRWVLWDLEGGYDSQASGSSDYTRNTFNYPEDDLLRHRWLFEKLLRNDSFKNEFIQRFAAHMSTSFHPDRVIQVIDSLKAVIQPEMSRDIYRWGDQCQTGCRIALPICNIASMRDWESNVDRMREFARNRTSFVRQHISEKFDLVGSAHLVLDFQEDFGGSLLVNGVAVSDSTSGLFFKGIPIRVIAKADVGFRFVEWQGISGWSSDTLTVTLEGDSFITAVFEPANASMLPTVITNDLVLKNTVSSYWARGDISVDSGATLTVEPGVELRMPGDASIYVYGGLKLQGSEEQPITILPNDAYGAERWGALCIMDAAIETEIANVHLVSASHGEDPLTQKAAISGLNSSIVLNNIHLEDVSIPIYVESCDLTMSEVSIDTDIKTGDYVNVRYGTTLIEKCHFIGKEEAEDVDAIDCDQVESAIIRSNKFYNINGDAIDFGYGSQNVVIRNNQIFGSLDKGVSIGESSEALIERNLIVNCQMGIAVKDSSFAIINQNTFFGNDIAVAIYEKTVNMGGASSVVLNSIFSKSVDNPYMIDELSTISIAHSLSDTDLLPGAGNISANPLFTEKMHTEFYLEEGSPCIDAGLPLYILAGDTLINMGVDAYAGLTPDIGAYEYGFVYDPFGTYLRVIPEDYELSQNFPNPFNPSTTIQYELPKQSNITLTVFDIRGKTVITLQEGVKSSGHYEVQWSGMNQQGNQVSTGVYFCRLKAGDYTQTIKMVYLR